MLKRKPKVLTPEQMEEIRTKDFFDCILPGTIKFLSDHYIVGDSYRCAWVIREYPPSTEEQAILSQLADRSGVTLRIYHRLVESMEQRKIIQNATRRNKLKSGGNDVNETIEAEERLGSGVKVDHDKCSRNGCADTIRGPRRHRFKEESTSTEENTHEAPHEAPRRGGSCNARLGRLWRRWRNRHQSVRRGEGCHLVQGLRGL